MPPARETRRPGRRRIGNARSAPSARMPSLRDSSGHQNGSGGREPEVEMTGSERTRPILLYAGGRRFCRWAARLVATLDHKEQMEAGHTPWQSRRLEGSASRRIQRARRRSPTSSPLLLSPGATSAGLQRRERWGPARGSSPGTESRYSRSSTTSSRAIGRRRGSSSTSAASSDARGGEPIGPSSPRLHEKLPCCREDPARRRHEAHPPP
jgi:hypothetical protein